MFRLLGRRGGDEKVVETVVERPRLHPLPERDTSAEQLAMYSAVSLLNGCGKFAIDRHGKGVIAHTWSRGNGVNYTLYRGFVQGGPRDGFPTAYARLLVEEQDAWVELEVSDGSCYSVAASKGSNPIFMGAGSEGKAANIDAILGAELDNQHRQYQERTVGQAAVAS